jgi:hypothetical protein
VVEEPWYLILFEAADVDIPFSPITYMGQHPTHAVTQPHGFDRELVPALDAVWFALHLPRRVHDTFDLPLQILQGSPKFDLAHRITMLPAPLLGEDAWRRTLFARPPALVLAPTTLLDEANDFARAAGVRLGVLSFDDLLEAHLRIFWRKIARFSNVPIPRRIVPIPLLPLTSVSATALSSQFLARQVRRERDVHRRRDDPYKLIDHLLHMHATVEALRRAEELGHTEATVNGAFRPLYRKAIRSIELDSVLAVPGVAPLYRRRLAASLGTPGEDDGGIEARVLTILAAHRGAARTARTFITPAIPSDVWGMYAQLEAHCTPGHIRPLAVWRMLRALGRRLAEVLGDEGTAVARRASWLTIFSDFPVGLTILPGDTSPLVSRTPLTQLPLTPLTRRLQFELAPNPFSDWTGGFRMLIAECLSPSDPIAEASAGIWEVIAETVDGCPGSRCDIVPIQDEAHLRAVLRAESYDLLLLSAHGAYDRSTNTAAICIRDTSSLLLDIEHVPAVVVLSACEISPRASGAVSVADLLFRLGASVVIGTLVPIRVDRNALLLNRFFMYVCDAITGVEQEQTLGAVWHRVLTTHAVHDIYGASRHVQAWAFSEQNGLTVDKEFKNARSVGRLHGGHIHRESEEVLLEIARDRGFEHALRSTLQSQGYFPESLFYTMLGRGDRIVLARSYLQLLRAR